MPILAGLFTGIFSSLVSFFGQFMAYRFATIVALIGVMTAVTAAFYALMSTILNGVSAALPTWPGMEIAVWVAAPDVLPVAASAAISADVAAAVYRWNLQQMRFLKV